MGMISHLYIHHTSDFLTLRPAGPDLTEGIRSNFLKTFPDPLLCNLRRHVLPASYSYPY
jgi:hypothetical protein